VERGDHRRPDLFWPANGREFGPAGGIHGLGSVAGSLLQFAIQLPTVMRSMGIIKPVFAFASESVKTVVRNFFPVFFSRGVVQISAFVDATLATLLGDGPAAALQYTQSLYTLPVSLFGMSVSAAELPAMSSAVGSTEEVASELRKRLNAGLKRIAVFIIPSSMGFLAFGDVMVGALYRTGRFGQSDVRFVWGTLAGAAVGCWRPHSGDCTRRPTTP